MVAGDRSAVPTAGVEGISVGLGGMNPHYLDKEPPVRPGRDLSALHDIFFSGVALKDFDYLLAGASGTLVLNGHSWLSSSHRSGRLSSGQSFKNTRDVRSG